MMSLYELAILGAATPEERKILTATIEEMLREFELECGDAVIFHDGESIADRDKHVAFAAAYFGGTGHPDLEAVRELVLSSVPVIPSISSEMTINTAIPDFLQSSNCLTRRNDDHTMSELAIALLECVGLLPTQRRAFVSYRRTESKAAAVQLHDLLSARGFDVFLDTHAIRPGDQFQEVLWHRLVDSDVLVMLDTPDYFNSRWTREELARARAKEIQVLRIIWPEHIPNQQTDLAETIYLEARDLEDIGGPISIPMADNVVLRVERLRSMSIAARYMSITGKLRADIDKIGGRIDSIGAHRALAVCLPDNRRIWAYPVVGVPTAEVFFDVADKARRAEQRDVPVVVYDHLGIHDRWRRYLAWLDQHIRTVRAINVSDVAWRLAAWED